jgi:hypothetical protein
MNERFLCTYIHIYGKFYFISLICNFLKSSKSNKKTKGTRGAATGDAGGTIFWGPMGLRAHLGARFY